MATITSRSTARQAQNTLRMRARKSTFHLGDIFCYAFLILAVLVTVYPLAWMVVSSFKPGSDIATAPLSIDLHTLSLNNYTAMFADVPLWIGFQNTLIVLLVQGGATLFLCPLAGFAFAKFRFRGKRFFFIFILATMMLPPIAMIIPLLFEMSALNWVDSYQGLIAPGLVNAFAIFWTRQQIADVPDELIEAARIDGCSPFGMYWRIILPLIRPALAALAIFTFLTVYNDFVWPVIIVNSDQLQTLQVQLSNLALQINNAEPGMTGHDAWGEILAASAVATIPVLILFIVLQRQFIRGILAGSVKG